LNRQDAKGANHNHPLLDQGARDQMLGASSNLGSRNHVRHSGFGVLGVMAVK
jgi:hypothetical protein